VHHKGIIPLERMVERVDYLIENPKRMTKEEIFQAFRGKWVYLVDIEGEDFRPWRTAMPVVAADKSWVGRDTGLYTQLREKYNDNWMAISFLLGETITGFTEVMETHAEI
jgi:hypothetical protein